MDTPPRAPHGSFAAPYPKSQLEGGPKGGPGEKGHNNIPGWIGTVGNAFKPVLYWVSAWCLSIWLFLYLYPFFLHPPSSSGWVIALWSLLTYFNQ